MRFGVPLRAGESNYTETGVETGLAGALLLIAWSLALLVALVRSAWAAADATFRVAAAGAAAAFAAVLALGIQTDAYGVPWLAYMPLVALRVACRPVRPGLTATLSARSASGRPVRLSFSFLLRVFRVGDLDHEPQGVERCPRSLFARSA